MKSWSQEIKETLRLGIPMAGAQLSQTLMSTTDVALVGRLQGESLAAMAVGHAAYGMVISLGIGVIAAVNPLVSQAHGANRPDAISRTVAVGLCSSFVLALMFCPLLWMVNFLFDALDYSPEMAQLATDYSRAISLGIPFALVYFVLKNYLESMSQPRLPMIVAMVGVVVNGLCGYSLMHGKFGLPALGVMGTGLGTSTVNFFMASALVFACWKPEFTQALKSQTKAAWKEFWGVGLPIAGSIGVEVGLFVVGAFMMGKLGPSEAGAHQIVLVCAATTFMVPLGVSFAGAARVGQAIGRGDFAAVRPAGLAAIMVGCGFMTLTAALFISVPDAFIALFWDPNVQDDEAVRRFATELLLIAGFFQILDGLQVTATGALRGMRDVKVPLIIAGLSYWIVGLGAASFLTFHTPLRHKGLWIGFLLGLGTAGIFLVRRFLKMSAQIKTDSELQKKVRTDEA